MIDYAKRQFCTERWKQLMSIKAVLFDLDGTLLPMNMDDFTTGYFGMLAKKLAPYGYEPKSLVDAIWTGTAAMVKNNQECTNEDAFWKKFSEILGEHVLEHKPIFEDFYANDFQKAIQFCYPTELANESVKLCKRLGFRTILATNPIFPDIATRSRIKWAGLDISDFELYTTYEKETSCKPNLAYYQSILERIGLKAEECVMVGNDVAEDMIASKLGMKVFLITEYMLNKKNEDYSMYPQGDFKQFMEWIAQIN